MNSKRFRKIKVLVVTTKDSSPHRPTVRTANKKDADKKLIKWAIEESSQPIVRNPYLKKAITDAEIQKKLDKQRGPSNWDVIYGGMSPQEKGSWNYEQRKKGMDGKTGDVLEKKKPIEPVKIDFNLTPWKK